MGNRKISGGIGSNMGETRSPGRGAFCFLAFGIMLGALMFWGKASAVELVTQETFFVENNPYKEYPFNVLFNKLKQGDEAERRKIRTVIILKQVFDPAFAQRSEAAGLRFTTHYGVVKELDGETLRLWLPETDSFKDFHVGIDRIPIVNKGEYAVSVDTIGHYAVIAHVMDDRIYKLDISFDLAAPTGLELKPMGDRNVVQWQPPQREKAPVAYRVFVNGKPYKTVEGRSIEMPRSKAQADSYAVRAVYVHGSARIESASSTTLYDVAAAKEIEQAQLAERTYAQIISRLNASQWADARRQLKENRDLLLEHAGGDRMATVERLIGFFSRVDAADGLLERQPRTRENLDRALAAYGEAEKEAGLLSGTVDLGGFIRQRIDHHAAVAVQLEKVEAVQAVHALYERIMSAVNAGDWSQAETLLDENRAILQEALDGEPRAVVDRLLEISQELAEGDRLSGIRPITAENIDAALERYRQAEARIADLPAGANLVSIVRQRVAEATGRKDAVEAERQRQTAGAVFENIVASMTPQGWETARTELDEKRSLLLAHLDGDQKAAVVWLSDFVNAIEAGDRLMQMEPATPEGLEEALAAYRRADAMGAMPATGRSLRFITQQRIAEATGRKVAMETERKRKRAEEMYAGILVSMTPMDWSKGQRQLYDNREFLGAQLDGDKQAGVVWLLGFFNDIDAGDQLAGIDPQTPESLDDALAAYRRAEERGPMPGGGPDLGFIVQQKIAHAADRRAALVTGRQQQLAVETFKKILGLLTPQEWENGRTQLYDNREFLQMHLDAEDKGIVVRLLSFFNELETGDRLAGVDLPTPESLDDALAAYRRADETGQLPGAGLDLRFIAKQKIAETAGRRAALMAGRQRNQAAETYAEIIGLMTPQDWEKGRLRLYETRAFLLEHLDGERKNGALSLLSFFNELEAGDRLAVVEPLTPESLEGALAAYRRADDKGQIPGAGPDLRFLSQQKISEVTDRRAMLEAGRQQQFADETYDQILTKMTPQDWERARIRLYENDDFLLEHLQGEKKAAVVSLISFFNELEAADRLAAIEPETPESLEQALSAYQRAEEKGSAVGGGFEVAFIPRQKITEISGRKAVREAGRQKKIAEDIYGRMIALTTPADWEKAEAMLYENSELFQMHMDPEGKTAIAFLLEFFKAIEAGDRLADIQPMTPERLDQAIETYRQAEEKGKRLGAELDVAFIARQKITRAAERKEALMAGRQKQLAEAVFSDITRNLTPEGWEKARSQLYDNRELLLEYLDEDRQQSVSALLGFFLDVDTGDRLAAILPESVEGFEKAIKAYLRAEDRAKVLPEALNPEFIIRLKIAEVSGKKQQMERQRRQDEAQETYARIVETLTPPDWETARTTLTDTQQLLLENLDETAKPVVTTLLRFFREIEAGDRLTEKEPMTDVNLELALQSYRQAAETAAGLPEPIDVSFISRLKISENEQQKNALKTRTLAAMAEETYEQMIVFLNPSEWEAAREEVYSSRDLMIDRLDERRRAVVLGLSTFFRDIDEGDRLADQQPETMRGLGLAQRFYERAQQRAADLSAEVDVSFIVLSRISAIEERKIALKGKLDREIAEEAYGRIVSTMNPAEWGKAKALIEENRLLLLEHLDRQKKELVLGLTTFFDHISEGDRLLYQEDESTRSVEMALGFFQRARQQAEAFADTLDASFIVESKIEEAQDLMALIAERNQREQAAQAYAQMIAAINPSQWQNAKSLLADHRDAFAAHLDSTQKDTVSRLAEFFDHIDAGDRLSGVLPETEESLNQAIAAYERSQEPAAAVAGVVDLGFITEMKIGNMHDRIRLLDKGREQERVAGIFEEIINGLTPADWENARLQLTQNEPLLTTQLDPARKEQVALLINFFQHMDEGDRVTAQQPESREDLEMALASYRLAEQKAQALAGTVDLSFLIQTRIDEGVARRTELENQRKLDLAANTYNQVLAALNPTDWETARDLSLEKMRLLTDYLDPANQGTAELLVDFFRDVQEGDRSAGQQPETQQTLDQAQTLYQQAEEKAVALSGQVDVMFIAEMKLQEIAARRDIFAQGQTSVAAVEPEPARPRVQQPALFDDTVDPETALQMALKNFDSRQYPLALRYFMHIYGKQIGSMRKGGRDQIFGLLGLPPNIRAEVTFLVQLEKLARENQGDEMRVREGLFSVLDGIENSTGPWSIITEQKKNKIRRHIDRF